jgi:predicted ATP-grasp superfamily ATP-dependent carboligase
MPSSSPARSSAEGIVVVGLSARLLAEAARRAGFAPLAVDLFGDSDLAAAAAACRRVDGPLEAGLDLAAVLAAIDDLALEHGAAPAGIVVGTAFEHRPEALAALGERLPLLGAPPHAVAAVKDPARLAGLLARLGIPHPEIAFEPPAGPDGWLVKRAGAAGGAHVRPAAEGRRSDGDYFQRRVEGEAWSATFVADGREARLLAFCRGLSAPAEGAPFRYGGVVGPVDAGAAFRDAVAAALDRLVPETGLLGLCGADLVRGASGWWLIEINPRPTAALEVIDRGAPPLMALHVAAAARRALTPWSAPATPAGAAVVFAPAAIAAIAAIEWPGWVADRPRPGTPIEAGGPIVTVRAEAATPASVRDKLASRAAEALRLAYG